MSSILQLPKWLLTDKNPAFYDLESATAIEQTAKVYGAMRDLIKHYNEFVESIEREVNKFSLENNEDLESFKVGIRQEFQDFIDIINLKVKGLSVEVDKAVSFMVENLETSVISVVESMRESGELSEAILTAFDNLTESLNSEISTRETAFNDLVEQITNESESRATTDTALSEQITAEAQARSTADTALSNQITAEAQARSAADEALSEQITAEAQARETAITEESEARQQAMTELEEDTAATFAALETDETEAIKVHFPYRIRNAGDCTIIEAYNQIIMIDCGVAGSEDELIQYLRDNDLTKIDHFIISHYHEDHIGNVTGFKAILDSTYIDTSATIFYLPHNNLSWNSCIDDDSYYVAMKSMETQIKTLINAAGNTIVYPTEGQVLTVGNAALKFINLTAADFTEYYSHTYDHSLNDTQITRYNNFSMVVELTHKNHVMLFTGDIEELAQSKIYNRIKSPDVLKIEHHCCNYITNDGYARKLSPKFAVTCDYDVAEYDDTFKRGTYGNLVSIPAVFSTNISGNIVITSTKNHLKAVSDHGKINTNDIKTVTSAKGIPYGADLNDFWEPGEYYSENTAKTVSIANTPENKSGFKLIVERLSLSGRAWRQTLICSSKRNCNIYTRTKYNDTIYKWTTMTPYSEGIDLVAGDDLNNCNLRCDYVSSSASVSNELLNCPAGIGGFKLVNHFVSESTFRQILLPNSYSEQYFFMRTISESDGVVTPWYRFNGTEV